MDSGTSDDIACETLPYTCNALNVAVYIKVGSVIFNTVSFGSRMFSDSTEYLIFELVRFIEQLSHFAFQIQTTRDKCTF